MYLTTFFHETEAFRNEDQKTLEKCMLKLNEEWTAV